MMSSPTSGQIREARLNNLPQFPERGNLSEAEYKNRLTQYYIQMRELQFGYVVRNEGMKLYNELKLNKLNSNVQMWQENPNPALADTAAVRTYDMQDRVNSGHLKQGMCCSITACALDDQICVKMGFDPLIDGIRNDHQPYIRVPWGMYQTPKTQEVIDEMCRSDDPKVKARGQYIDKNNKKNYTKKTKNAESNLKSIDALIKEEILQPGDAFGILNDGGSHAMTLTDVSRDESGKIVGYTLQACNKDKYEYYSMGSGQGKSKVCTIVPLSYHAVAEISKEAQELQQLSIEDMEIKCRDVQTNTNSVIEDLYKTENRNRTISNVARNSMDNIYDREYTYLNTHNNSNNTGNTTVNAYVGNSSIGNNGIENNTKAKNNNGNSDDVGQNTGSVDGVVTEGAEKALDQEVEGNPLLEAFIGKDESNTSNSIEEKHNQVDGNKVVEKYDAEGNEIRRGTDNNGGGNEMITTNDKQIDVSDKNIKTAILCAPTWLQKYLKDKGLLDKNAKWMNSRQLREKMETMSLTDGQMAELKAYCDDACVRIKNGEHLSGKTTNKATTKETAENTNKAATTHVAVTQNKTTTSNNNSNDKKNDKVAVPVAQNGVNPHNGLPTYRPSTTHVPEGYRGRI